MANGEKEKNHDNTIGAPKPKIPGPEEIRHSTNNPATDVTPQSGEQPATGDIGGIY